MAKQVRLRRGTTAEHADFVGANGEITVDTVKHVVIVHDGVTAGGWPSANAAAVDATLATLTANAANQAASINTLLANAATQATTLNSLVANAAAQQAGIDAFILASNATALFANIAGVQANVTAANAAIALLIGNAVVQSEAIVLANSNIISLQSNAAAQATALNNLAANAAVQQASIDAFVLASNASAIFANIAGVQANVTAANAAIASTNSNLAIVQSTVANINANLDSVSSSVSPSANVTYDLGTTDRRWRDLYLSGNTINLGDATLSVVGGAIQSSLPFSAPITATNLTVSGTSIDFASGGYIAETEVLDGNLNPAGYYGISVNSSDDGIISLNALDSNSVVMSSVFVTNSTVQLNVANNIPGGSSYNWIFDSYGGLSAPAQGIVYLDNPGALQFLDPSAASFSVGTIASVGNLGFGDSTYQTTAFSNSAVATYLANFDGSISFTASPAIITGLGNIDSAKVWTGNLEFIDGTYQTTANIMQAGFTMANSQHWTGNVSTIGEALNQLAERIYNIENP